MAEPARIPSLPGGNGGGPGEPLWRQVLGQRLRAMRLRRGETLSATASRAAISPQYLSEIERGRKEPSSELIAAVAGALDTTLLDLTEQVASDLRRQQSAAAPRAFSPRTFTPRASALARAA